MLILGAILFKLVFIEMVYFLITSVIYLFLQATYIRKIQEIPIV